MASPDVPEELLHDVEETVETFRNLPERDKANLMRAAQFLAGRGNLASPQELLSEAFIRIADGRRRWKKSETFPFFVGGVLKSLASDRMFLTDDSKVKRLKQGFAVVSSDDEHRIPDSADGKLAAKKGLIELAIRHLEVHYAGDEEMELLLMGIQDGLIGQDLQDLLGVDAKRLEALRTRLNRQIDKMAETFKEKEGAS